MICTLVKENNYESLQGIIYFLPHYLAVWTVPLCGADYCYRMHSKLQLKPIQQPCFVTAVFPPQKCYRPHGKLPSCQSRLYFFFTVIVALSLPCNLQDSWRMYNPLSPFFHISLFHSLVPPFYYLWLLYGFRSSREPWFQPSSSSARLLIPEVSAYSATAIFVSHFG